MAVRLARMQKIADGDDVPKRRIDGVVFRLATVIGKAIRQHSIGHTLGPRKQDLFGRGETSQRQAESPQCDECVSAPVRKPRVSRDDRASIAASNDAS